MEIEDITDPTPAPPLQGRGVAIGKKSNCEIADGFDNLTIGRLCSFSYNPKIVKSSNREINKIVK